MSLDQWPSYDELDSVEENLAKALECQQKTLKSWSSRMKMAKAVENDYKRANFVSTSKSDGALLLQSSLSCSETLAMIKGCEGNEDLNEALLPIRGKESTMLPSEGTVSACVAQVRGVKSEYYY